MTNQLVVVTKIVEGKPPEKMAILVNNIFQIRPRYTNIPAIPATPAIVSSPGMTSAKSVSGANIPNNPPIVRDSFGNAVHDNSNTLMPGVPGSRDAAGNIIPPESDQTSRDSSGNLIPRDADGNAIGEPYRDASGNIAPRPAARDASGNLLPGQAGQPVQSLQPGQPGHPGSPATVAETGCEIDFQNGKIVVAETLAQIISQAG